MSACRSAAPSLTTTETVLASGPRTADRGATARTEEVGEAVAEAI